MLDISPKVTQDCVIPYAVKTHTIQGTILVLYVYWWEVTLTKNGQFRKLGKLFKGVFNSHNQTVLPYLPNAFCNFLPLAFALWQLRLSFLTLVLGHFFIMLHACTKKKFHKVLRKFAIFDHYFGESSNYSSALWRSRRRRGCIACYARPPSLQRNRKKGGVTLQVLGGLVRGYP